MATFAKGLFSWSPMLRPSLFHYSVSSLSPSSFPLIPVSCFNNNSVSSLLSTQASIPIDEPSPIPERINRWKPMCLYHTQGKCTMMDDPLHIEKFDHNCSWKLKLVDAELKNIRSQKLDYFLVLDLEGKVEILEFPVLMIDAKTLEIVNLFHRFVRPSAMTEQRINEYIEGKYGGKLGVDGVWHETAIPFKEVIQQFEDWMLQHGLWKSEIGGCLQRAAFVTCGNWDLKTKVPQQCKVSGIKLPEYFMEWINLKDVFLNFYNRRAPGMVSMMKELKIPLLGSHHLGIDDSKNIAKVLQRMLIDGARIQITARRNSEDLDTVEFLFKNRIGIHPPSTARQPQSPKPLGSRV